MRDIPRNIEYQRWFTAGIVGSIAALIPRVGIIWAAGAMGFELSDGASMVVALVVGSFGGAWSYHSLIQDRRRTKKKATEDIGDPIGLLVC